MVEEAIPAMLLLEDEYEGDLVNGIVFEHILVTLCDDILCIINTDDFKSVVQVRHGNLLDLKHVVRVKDGFEVFSRQERRLELIE